jgi:hypothetical protein
MLDPTPLASGAIHLRSPGRLAVLARRPCEPPTNDWPDYEGDLARTHIPRHPWPASRTGRRRREVRRLRYRPLSQAISEGLGDWVEGGRPPPQLVSDDPAPTTGGRLGHAQCARSNGARPRAFESGTTGTAGVGRRSSRCSPAATRRPRRWRRWCRASRRTRIRGRRRTRPFRYRPCRRRGRVCPKAGTWR